MKPLATLPELNGADALFVPPGAVVWALAAATAQMAAAAQWVPIGPRGDIGTGDADRVNGRIASIQILARGGGYHLYVGASSGGLWRMDSTRGFPPLWEDLGQNLPHPSVGAFVTDSSNPDDILVGTGDWREGGAGMFHTQDRGVRWGKVPLPSAPNAFYRMAYSLNSLEVVFAASDAGLFRSEHGPDGPWANVLNGVVSDFVLHPSNPNVVYACRAAGALQGGGVYKSTDGGKTWMLKLASAFAPEDTVERGSIAICRNSPNVLAVVWEIGGAIVAIERSSDGGETWPANITGDLAGGGAGQAGHVLSIAIAPDNPNEIYVGASGLWPSFDGGATWNVAGMDFAISGHEDHTQLYFNPLDDRTLWLCNDGGVYAYTRGGTRSMSYNGDSVNGLQVSQIHNIDAKHNLRFAVMQDDGVNGSIDGGRTWKQFHGKDGAEVVITNPDVQDPAFWYIWGMDEGLWPVARGTFNGAQQPIASPNPKYAGLFYDRFQDRVFVVTPQTQVLSFPPQATGTDQLRLEASQSPGGFEGITGSYLDGRTLYLWVKGAPTTYNVAVLRRSGQSWNVTTTLVGAPGEVKGVTQVVASRQWSGEAWAVLAAEWSEARIFHSTDHEATWIDITGDLKTTVLFEGFEGDFPADNGWSAGDDNRSGTPAFWAPVNSSFGGEGTHNGAGKGYCAGSSHPFGSSEPNPVYQDHLIAFMQRGVGLAGFTRAELRFWYKIPSIESEFDKARVLVDGGVVWTGNSAVTTWTEQVISLDAYVGGMHTLRFEFVADATQVREGWYLDDIQVIGAAQAIGAINTMAVSPFDANELYIGTGMNGVFRTLDGGRHWQPFQEGLPFVSVRDMIYLVDESHAGTDRLVIGTYGRGMYERALNRPGPGYVDQLFFINPPLRLGTIEFPWPDIGWGISFTPPGGYLLLNGNFPYWGGRTLTKPMTIGAYEFPARLGL